jgi:hypothetical protein
MGKDKLKTFDKFTERTDKVLNSHFVHDKLLAIAFARKKKGFSINLEASQTPNIETPWICDVDYTAGLGMKLGKSRVEFEKQSDMKTKIAAFSKHKFRGVPMKM